MDDTQQNPQEGGFLAAALDYHRRGWRPIPITERAKYPPLVKWTQYQDRAPTEDEITEWWTRWPNANIGIVTGNGSGLFAVDIDTVEAAGLVEDLVDGLATPTNITAKGKHLIFQMPDEHVGNRTKIEGGIDVREQGAYFIAPPSVHPTGARYRWDDEHNRGLDCPVALIPSDLLQRLKSWKSPASTSRSRPAAHSVESNEPFQLPDIIPEGTRNDTLFRYAASLRAKGSSPDDVSRSVADANTARCTVPLSGDEVAALVQSASRYSAGDSDSEHFTDLGNARRLVRRFGTGLRYVPAWSAWYVWDQGYWARDNTGEVERRAKDTVGGMYADASVLQDSGQRAALAKWALASESEKHLKAMVGLARSEPGIATAVESLDQDPWLFNVANGTIDLKSGVLRLHDPSDLITRMVRIPYEPDAEAPRWLAFLDTVTAGDRELVAYLQRFVGYSLTGTVGEQKMAFLHGFGANGKTTFLNTILEILGPYGKQADPQLLMARASDAHPTNVADLLGSRFVVCSEVDEGRNFAEATVKQLTGGDRLKARLMRQDFFEFQPTHKVWMAANHQPVVKGTDHAFWRRMMLIPFEVTIPAADRDPDLPCKLRAELPGILAWAVRGCLAWQQGGLREPACVLAASDAYRSSMDLIASFVEECCVEEPVASVFGKELYGVYQRWCAEGGVHPCSMPSFGRRMKERGCRAQRSTGGRTKYQGIAIRPVVVEEVEDPIDKQDTLYEGLFGERNTEDS